MRIEKSRSVRDDRNIDVAERQQRLNAACRGFEGVLLGEMLKAMQQAEKDPGGIIPTSRAERIFLQQQCEVLGDYLAQGEPLGVARLMRQALSRTGGGSCAD